jgi:multidrug efflux pump subunit AcrA (membrane-fusion protein)
VISPCPVEFIDSIQLPALETGQIIELYAKEGDAVPAGKTVGQINDQLFKSMLEQAKLKQAMADQKANDNTSLMAAKNEIALAQVEYDRTKKLASTGSKSQSEYEKARFSLRLAMLKEVAAQNEKDNANGELQIESSRMREVNERIRRHALVAPSSFDGHVIEILRHELEWVNAGEPVMRVARMDRLWVQGVVDANVVNPHEIVNRPVTVTLRLARGETTDFQGKIVHVGLERESSDRFLVKAEVQNRPVQGHWVLQPNSTVTMRIHLGGEDADTAAMDGQPVPTQNR